jgi:GH15 family glucan-1,4-alpha-glucosidase
VIDLAMIGRRDEAEQLFDRLISLKSDLGLFSEEYDQVNKRLIGNTPQAFTHLTLIAGAKALSNGAGR